MSPYWLFVAILVAACGGSARTPATALVATGPVAAAHSGHWCINTLEIESTTTPETYLGTARVEHGIITGTFRNARTGERLFGATVVAQPPTGNLVSEITDETGQYRITAAPGAYHVTAYYMDTMVEIGDVDVPVAAALPAHHD